MPQERAAGGDLSRGALLAATLTLAVLLAAALAVSLALGRSRHSAPSFAGSYRSQNACLGAAFTIAQSGEFVNLGGGPGGAFRLHDGVLRGRLRCRAGTTSVLSLRPNAAGRLTGSLAGRAVVLTTAPPSLLAKPTLAGEDAIGRLLLAMAVVIVFARLAGLAAARIRQPRVIGEVTAGILLGPTLLGALAPSTERYLFPAAITPMLTGLSQVGLVLYLFLVGMEFDPTLLRGRLRQAALVSSASVAVPLGLGLLAAVPLYGLLAPAGIRYSAFALFVGVALSVTAVPVLARILDERRMLTGPVGVLALSAAALGDVAGWGLVALALALTRAGSALASLAVIGWTALLVAVMLVTVRPFLSRAAVAYAEVGQLPAIWTGTLFVGVFLAGFAAERAGVAPIFGAFVLGSVMPRNAGLTSDISRRVEDFVVLILLPLFFVVNGLQVDLTGLDNSTLWAVTLTLVALAVLGKLGGGFAAARFAGFSRRDAGVIGALMNTRGLTELIVLNIALSAGAISTKLFSMLVLMAIVTTAMAGPLLRVLDPRRELSADADREVDEAAPGTPAQRSIVVAIQDERNLDGLLEIAAGLARSQPPRELVVVEALRRVGLVAGRLRDQDELTQAARRLDERRRLLAAEGIVARVAAFGSSDGARDYARIASREQVDLVLIDGRRPLFGETILSGAAARLLDQIPCDVAVLVEQRSAPLIDERHPVAVPFGGAEHDWAALELGAAVAAARRATLRLVGAAATAGQGDASRLLEQATLVVKAFLGVEAEAVLATPGSGILGAAGDAGLLVVGLASDWREHGIGRVRVGIARGAAGAVLFVRRGSRPGLLGADAAELTRLRWSSLDSRSTSG